MARTEPLSAPTDGVYLRFYGLAERPFNLTPDPKFLVLTPGHREALAQLVYGVQERKGFILLTGEVGTGKTTLLRTLLTRLDAKTDVAYVINSGLPFDDILEYVLADLGVTAPGTSRAQRLMALNRALIERRRAGVNTVIIIDEAQHLDVETLEQLRLLSNFETASDKLLQIVLAGQPELRAKLLRPELRQLRQRVGLRCTLTPLDAAQVEEYIVSHLRVAGARHRQLFSLSAIRRIADYSRGIPRVINLICDHSLLIGYANQVRRIDVDIVSRAIEYLEESGADVRGARPARFRPLQAARYAGVFAAGGVAAIVLAALSGYAASVNGISNGLLESVSDFLHRLYLWWAP